MSEEMQSAEGEVVMGGNKEGREIRSRTMTHKIMKIE